MSRGRGILRFSLAALAGGIVLLSPASASASNTIGSSLAFNGSGAAQAGCNPLCTFIPTAVAGGGPVTSPIDGVVVRWGASGSDFANPMLGATTSTVRLRVIRKTIVGNNWTGLGTGPVEHTAVAFQNSFFTLNPGMRIAAGDYIGVDTARDDLTTTGSVLRTAAAASYVSFTTTLPDGGAPHASAPIGGFEAYVQATIEPDADQDLFGDETQDQCPGVAGPQAGCQLAAAPAPTAAPVTKKKRCKKKRKKHSASAAKKKRCKKKHKRY